MAAARRPCEEVVRIAQDQDVDAPRRPPDELAAPRLVRRVAEVAEEDVLVAVDEVVLRREPPGTLRLDVDRIVGAVPRLVGTERPRPRERVVGRLGAVQEAGAAGCLREEPVDDRVGPAPGHADDADLDAVGEPGHGSFLQARIGAPTAVAARGATAVSGRTASRPTAAAPSGYLTFVPLPLED